MYYLCVKLKNMYKKLLLIAMLLFTVYSNSQEVIIDSLKNLKDVNLDKSKYKPNKFIREVTLSSEVGINFNSKLITQESLNLYYEFGNKYYLQSWNGFGFRQDKSSWFTSVQTINKTLEDFSFGAGFMYTTGDQNSYISNTSFKKDIYILGKVNYKIKL